MFKHLIHYFAVVEKIFSRKLMKQDIHFGSFVFLIFCQGPICPNSKPVSGQYRSVTRNDQRRDPFDLNRCMLSQMTQHAWMEYSLPFLVAISFKLPQEHLSWTSLPSAKSNRESM